MDIIKDFNKYKLNEQIHKQYQKKLKTLSSQLLLTEDRIYRNIAIQLHDNLGQSLSLCMMKLKELREDNHFIIFDTKFQEITELINKSINYTRSFISDIPLPERTLLSLEAAVESLKEVLKEKCNIIIKKDKKLIPIDTDINNILYRAIRELLANIYKHAKANNVEISIKRKINNVIIGVKDDGIGFNVAKIKNISNIGENFGLYSLIEQINDIGGTVEIKSRIRNGTDIIIRAPLKIRNYNLKKA